MPSWSLARGAFIFSSRQPSKTGLVAWFKGDVGILPASPATGNIVSWADSSGHGQDLDDVGPSTRAPLVGLDDIDGIPAVSFPIAGTSDVYIRRLANLVDRNGDPIEAGPRTVFVVTKPKFSASNFSITGGPAFTFFNNTLPQFGCLFDLESNFVVNGAYCWSSAWRDPANALQATPLVGGAGGPYDHVPTLLEWRTTGYPQLDFLLNNALTTLTPAVQYGGTGPSANTGFMLGNEGIGGAGLNYQGSFSEVLVYDYDLTTAPSQHAKTIAYLRTRYPSIPLV